MHRLAFKLTHHNLNPLLLFFFRFFFIASSAEMVNRTEITHRYGCPVAFRERALSGLVEQC
jgi:hypothetical protein